MQLCRQYLPETLVGEDSFEEHLAVARQLPPYFADDFGYEIYLDRPDSRAGVSFFVRPKTSGWDFLCGRKASAQNVLFAKPAWERVRDFCLAVENEADWFPQALRGIWFEFDIDAGQTIKPDIFIALQRFEVSTPVAEKMIVFAAEQLGNTDFLNNAPALVPCLQQIPVGSGVLNFGLLLARNISGVRLEIYFPQGLAALYTYLEQISWPGSLKDLRTQTNWLATIPALPVLQIDLGQSVAPKMSIYLQSRGEKIAGMDRDYWSKLLSPFVTKGLCLPTKQMALLGFSGGTREVLGIDFVLLRGLSHAKITYGGPSSLWAKGYFGFMCQ